MQTIANYKILLVDDEKEILNILEKILLKEGFTRIYKAKSYHDALNIMHLVHPDFAVLDIMLPDGDGLTLFQEIKSISPIPVLFLTAKDQDCDKLLGLGLGADDYITKPFLPKELVLRIHAILRRVYIPFNSSQKFKPAFTIGDCHIDLNTGVIKNNSTEYAITAKEYAILETLYQNRNRIVSPDTLCQAVWNDDSYGYENTLMVHIRRLRAKIEKNPSEPNYIITVKGLGYKLIIETT